MDIDDLAKENNISPTLVDHLISESQESKNDLSTCLNNYLSNLEPLKELIMTKIIGGNIRNASDLLADYVNSKLLLPYETVRKKVISYYILADQTCTSVESLFDFIVFETGGYFKQSTENREKEFVAENPLGEKITGKIPLPNDKL